MDTRIVNDVTVVTLMKRFDSDTAPGVETAIKELIAKGGEKIVCDFSDVEYINSTGLRVLLSAVKAMSKSGGRFNICSLRPSVRNVFEIAGFTKIFRIFGSCEEALEEMA
ncbi:MAG TPA: STAS domain-containing protein [Methanoregulaceae archaeon]|nr:STAS domain-containing protein [Methanoregulaceae archaeon]